LLERAGVSKDDSMVFLDPAKEVAEKWGITGTPSSVIVDEQLRVVRQVFGIETNHAAHEAFAPVIK
jgi:hypothetical protein